MPTSRPKRSARTPRRPEVRARLERSRERVRTRRQLARQREQLIAAAVKQYIAAWDAITNCETARDREIEDLRAQIARVHERAAEQITAHRVQQALAAAAIRDQGQTDDDVAELLEISAKQARQLIAAARADTDSELSSAVNPPAPAPLAPKLPTATESSAIVGPAQNGDGEADAGPAGL
ncbi:hypothetical protein ACFYT3_31130 [Nocardia amikacinitolerans]|uniref:hypothetical protein n=1 Tax=Nocardia amikacinitolerans TaxID=756689 RepID=UPI00369CE9F3